MRLMVPGRRRWLTPPVPKVLLWGLWATGHLQNFRFKGAVLQGSVPGRPATALGFLKQLLCDSVSETSMQDDQTLAKIMDEAIQTRKNLDKLVAKLKKDKGNQATLCCINAYPSRGPKKLSATSQQPRDITSMEECISKLGSLYDDLAGIQAEVKVNGVDDKFLCRNIGMLVLNWGYVFLDSAYQG